MHAPAVIGYLVGLAQFCGGLAILTGLGAIFLVHSPQGFDIGKGGMEYALTQLLIACALLLTRAGKYSLTLPQAETLRSTGYCPLRILKCESRRRQPVREFRYDPWP
jgi:hypothetical protein